MAEVAVKETVSSGQRYFYIDPILVTLSHQMQGLWRACDSVIGIIHAAVGVKAPVVLLSFQRHDVLRNLAEAVHTLRLLLGKQANIVLVERDASLRFQSEALLLRLGASLVVHRNIPLNRIPLMLESLQGQVFNREIEMKFETALASLVASNERGYLPPTRFVAEAVNTLERLKALHLPCALVIVRGSDGLSCTALLSALHVTRAGDLTSTDGEQCFIFFGCCPENSIERALHAMAGDETKPWLQGAERVTNPADIIAHLHALDKATQDKVLADLTRPIVMPNPLGHALIEVVPGTQPVVSSLLPSAHVHAVSLPDAVVSVKPVKPQVIAPSPTGSTTKVLTSPGPVYTTTVRQKARRILINEEV